MTHVDVEQLTAEQADPPTTCDCGSPPCDATCGRGID